mgnify:CR=1 FL=1
MSPRKAKVVVGEDGCQPTGDKRAFEKRVWVRTGTKISRKEENAILETIENFISIDSPMVGIIYLTPKPSSPPFAKKGQKIKKGDTICLIEAMKTFNEIKSDRDCIIKTVMVKNGEAVEFGQPLFEIS